MRKLTIDIYTFDELTPAAKQRALDNFRAQGEPYLNWDEAKRSLDTFCEHLGIHVTKYSVSTTSHSYVDTTRESYSFRGKKLKQFDRDHMPTGYCADCDLWQTFYDQFKATGDATHAFKEAIAAWIKAVVADMEYHDSDAAIIEYFAGNEYEFYSDGRVL